MIIIPPKLYISSSRKRLSLEALKRIERERNREMRVVIAVLWGISVLLILGILVMSLSGCTKKGEPSEVIVETNGLSNLKLQKRCIEGHVYYISSTGYHASIAPVLTDDGKPVLCKEAVKIH
jgi:hypothetical protein